MKFEVGKLDIYKLIIVPTNLDYLKTKVDDLDIGKLKIIPIDLRKLSDVVSKEVVKIQNTQQTKYESI